MLMEQAHSLVLLVDVQEKLTPQIHDAQLLIHHCSWLLKIADLMNIPIMVSEQYPKGLGPTLSELSALVPHATTVEKLTFSCAADQNSLQALNHLGKDQIIIIGIEAHVCILQTALGLQQMGKSVFVVTDAVGSRHPQDKKIALKRMAQNQIELVTKEMVVFEWLKQSDHLLFKKISQEYLKA